MPSDHSQQTPEEQRQILRSFNRLFARNRLICLHGIYLATGNEMCAWRAIALADDYNLSSPEWADKLLLQDVHRVAGLKSSNPKDLAAALNMPPRPGPTDAQRLARDLARIDIFLEVAHLKHMQQTEEEFRKTRASDTKIFEEVADKHGVALTTVRDIWYDKRFR